MSEKGMAFCDWKVRYIAGMKGLGQTRWVIRHVNDDPYFVIRSARQNPKSGKWGFFTVSNEHILDWDQHSRYQPGDRVYVKEGLFNDFGWAHYRADKRPVELCPDTITPWKWKRDVLSSRLMPKWAARYWLAILDVRAERLQEITEEDAIAEGVEPIMRDTGGYEPWGTPCPDHADYRSPFAELWDSLHGKGAWDRNPWVFRYVFRKEE